MRGKRQRGKKIQFNESEITVTSFVKNLSTEAFKDARVFFSRRDAA
jgi:hypothetical protein